MMGNAPYIALVIGAIMLMTSIRHHHIIDEASLVPIVVHTPASSSSPPAQPKFNDTYEQWADKWFPDADDHYHGRFFHGPVSRQDRHRILERLFNDTRHIMKMYNISYWLDAGSLLGSYRNGRIIDWDPDGDIGVLTHELKRAPLISRHANNKTVMEVNPNFIYRQIQNKNQVDGRITDISTGVYIDIFAFDIRRSYLVCKWFDGYSSNEFGFLNHPYTDVFPLQPCTISSIKAYCPHQIKSYLLQIYTSLEPPT